MCKRHHHSTIVLPCPHRSQFSSEEPVDVIAELLGLMRLIINKASLEGA